ncbi:MAG TPA: hypothetical protein VH599_07375 [Ktedonobacterales bacterium]|jgi:hypothetical protein
MAETSHSARHNQHDERSLPERASRYVQGRLDTLNTRLRELQHTTDYLAGGTINETVKSDGLTDIGRCRRDIALVESARAAAERGDNTVLGSILAEDIHATGEEAAYWQGRMKPMRPEDRQQNPHQIEAMRGDRVFARAVRIASTPNITPEAAQDAQEIMLETERGNVLNEMEARAAVIREFQGIQSDIGYPVTPSVLDQPPVPQAK